MPQLVQFGSVSLLANVVELLTLLPTNAMLVG